jgi:hypothetical protein
MNQTSPTSEMPTNFTLTLSKCKIVAEIEPGVSVRSIPLNGSQEVFFTLFELPDLTSRYAGSETKNL